MMDHRLALASLTTLLILAAAPLAWAWARLLPEERSSFEVGGRNAETAQVSDQASRDPLVVCLLALVTLSYIMKVPSIPVGAALQWVAKILPPDYFQWFQIAGRAFFVVTPGLAVAYGAVRKGPFRVLLILAGTFVVALWLASPYLHAAIQR